MGKPARKTQLFFLFARTHYVFVAPWKLMVVLLKITAVDRLVACLVVLCKWYAEGRQCIGATFPAESGQDTSLHQSEEIRITWAHLAEST